MKNILIIILILLINPASAYILDIPPKPEYCDDCIIPRNVELMEIKETYQFVVLVSMLFVNLLLMYLMYLPIKKSNPDAKFDYQYLIYAVLGVFIGFGLFLPIMRYEGTYLEIFMASGAFALAGEGLINKGRKVAQTVLKNGQ